MKKHVPTVEEVQTVQYSIILLLILLLSLLGK
ncbi:MAG: hypothetical protein RL222_822 [Bacteroidota bacterium]|jgi:hypothetical protein